jgi:uncharacterized SAM-binding protein YcdF (DUF218 family)
MNGMIETIREIGPAFAAFWIITIGAAVIWPQRYFNSMLLMMTLMFSMIFVSGFFGEGAGYFLLICFLLVMLGLFLAPILLMLNGVQMIRKEGFSLSHVLSFGLGLFIDIGEIAAVIYVLGLSDYISIGRANVWVFMIFITVFYFSFLVLSFVIYSILIQIMPHRMSFDYIIIHGSGLKNGEILTRLLQSRVDKAIEIYRKCRVKPVIIPSGGKGRDEKISEARAMRDYLVSEGIPEEHIVMEENSVDTKENLKFSKAIIDGRGGSKRTALVSSNYHIYRCLRLAREMKFKYVGIGAEVAPYFWPSALIREFIAVFLTPRFLFWALLGWLLCISPLVYAVFSR